MIINTLCQNCSTALFFLPTPIRFPLPQSPRNLFSSFAGHQDFPVELDCMHFALKFSNAIFTHFRATVLFNFIFGVIDPLVGASCSGIVARVDFSWI